MLKIDCMCLAYGSHLHGCTVNIGGPGVKKEFDVATVAAKYRGFDECNSWQIFIKIVLAISAVSFVKKVCAQLPFLNPAVDLAK